MNEAIGRYLDVQVAGQGAVRGKGFLLDAVNQFNPFEQCYKISLHGFSETMFVREYYTY